MIKKIVFSLFTICLLVAFFLYLFGIKEVHLGGYVHNFLKVVAHDLNAVKFQIPNIPRIPIGEIRDFWTGVLVALQSWVNTMVGILNLLTALLNFIIYILEFLFILIRNLTIMKDKIVLDQSIQQAVFESACLFI